MSDLFSTPVTRQGPTSRLMRRRSNLPQSPPGIASSITMQPAVLSRTSTASTDLLPHAAAAAEAAAALDRSGHAPFLDHTLGGGFGNKTVDVSMPYAIDDRNAMDMTLKNSEILAEENPGVRATENLFVDFLATCSNPVSDVAEALDQVAEFEQIVGDHTSVLRNIVAKFPTSKQKFPKTIEVLDMLLNERNTWRLVGKLYHDRLTRTNTTDDDMRVIKHSETRVIERLFARDGDLRQGQAVVDWLELNAKDNLDDIYAKSEYFSDGSVGWENTLAALQIGPQHGSVRKHMVNELDPDAPRRQGKPLHDLDMQDQAILVKAIWMYVRAGCLDVAQELCVRVGQPWRAATLEGWKLFHDPNYDQNSALLDAKLSVEGNAHRDVWKRAAWKLTTDEKMSPQERAIYAAFCGNVKQLSALCTSWEDRLWAYAKCMVDLRVETEIRETMPRSFAQLPQEFWDNKRSLSDILSCVSPSLESGSSGDRPYRLIQSHLIRGDWPGLAARLAAWLDPDGADADPRVANNPHLLRLMAHLVILFRRFASSRLPSHAGHTPSPPPSSAAAVAEAENQIMEAYVDYLIAADRVQQIAWYTAQLPPHRQVDIYAQFLEAVDDEADRRLCLALAAESELPVSVITVRVVENVRTREEAGDHVDTTLAFQAETTDKDLAKIDALSWLIFDVGQRDEAIFQANALVRALVAAGKTAAAKLAIDKLPSDSIDVVSQPGALERMDEQLSPRTENAVREFLGFQALIEAHEAFSDWFSHYHKGQPKRPVLPEKATFTEQVAHEQKDKQYQIELERWNGAQLIRSRSAEQRLRRVLTFPHGWLVDQADAEDAAAAAADKQRQAELVYLRKVCLPQITTLLHSVMHSTHQYDAAIALADLVASEQFGLYAVFNKEGMQQLLAKIRDSAVAAMENNADGAKDAWGYKKE